MAIYAETTKWAECNNQVSSDWSQEALAASMVPYYTNKLFPAKLKILIYSGDVDTVVPATSKPSDSLETFKIQVKLSVQD